ncbi:hypothetical protein GCM10027347_56320 [Larkinella harenae]
MAAATAFFSLFALPPIIIILSQLYSGLMQASDQRMNLQLFAKLSELVGTRSAQRLQDISHHLQQPRSTRLLTTLSIGLLVLSSTTLLGVIKSSLNQLWQVRPVADRPIRYVLVDRVLALAIILAGGLLFSVSLTLNRALKLWESHWLMQLITTSWTRPLARYGESIVLLTIGVALIFKYLPDIRIRWSAVWVGALVTAVLLKFGEQLLNRLLVQSAMSSIFGSSGALMLILLFAFYASLIFYYGASFTRCYTLWRQLEGGPGAQAVAYQIKEVKKTPSTVPKPGKRR